MGPEAVVPERERDSMDDLIDRASGGEATEAELAELAMWRAASADNERTYRATMRLLDAGRALAKVDAGIARPSAAEIIARTGSRHRFAGRTAATRWAPWVIAAAAVVVAAVSLRWRRAETTDVIPGWGATEVVTGASELATVQLGSEPGSSSRRMPTDSSSACWKAESRSARVVSASKLLPVKKAPSRTARSLVLLEQQLLRRPGSGRSSHFRRRR
jgi:ferric-dicitrate binding protein FerR (iron transport regulator)